MNNNNRDVLLKIAEAIQNTTTIEQAVGNWLEDHPEATTTVQDGSITKAKLDENLQETVDEVSDLKSALSALESSVLDPGFVNRFLYRDKTSEEINGLTISISDGIVSISGTTSQATTIEIPLVIPVDAGDYYFNNFVTYESVSELYGAFTLKTKGNQSIELTSSTNRNKQVTIANDVGVAISLYFGTNKTLHNTYHFCLTSSELQDEDYKDFVPSECLSDYLDHTYAPVSTVDEIANNQNSIVKTNNDIALITPMSKLMLNEKNIVSEVGANNKKAFIVSNKVWTDSLTGVHYYSVPVDDLSIGLYVKYSNLTALGTALSNCMIIFANGGKAADQPTTYDYLSPNNITTGYNGMVKYESQTGEAVILKEKVKSRYPSATHMFVNVYMTGDEIKNCTYISDKSVNERIETLEENGNIPSFVYAEGNDTFKRVMNWAGNDKFAMIAQITDVHTAGTEKYKAVGYLNKLNELYGFDIIGNFGDIGLDTSSESETNGWDIIRETKWCMDATSPWFFCKGNHDHGRVLLLTDSNLSNIYEMPFAKQARNMYASGKCYGYIDLEPIKIKAIYLNTSEEKQNGNYDINPTQLTWLATTLASVQEGWDVVILSHMCVDTCGRWNSYPNDASGDNFDTLRSIMSGFVAKTSGSNSGSGVSWDFTGVPSSCKLICSFAGDSHFNNDAVTNGVQYIVRQGYGGISTSEIATGGTRDDFNYETQCLFDVLCIKKNGNAKVFRIGAGGSARDLTFTY